MRKFWETCNNYQVSKYILEEKKTVSLIYEHLAIFSSTSLLVLVHMKKKTMEFVKKGRYYQNQKCMIFVVIVFTQRQILPVTENWIFLWLRNKFFKTVYDFVP